MSQFNKWIVGVVLGASVGMTSAAVAQQQPQQGLPNARPVWENVSGGAIATRLPGRIVRAGTVRYRTAHAATIHRARNGPTITETEPPIDPVTQLKVDLLTTIFQDLNVALPLLLESFIGGGGTPGGGGNPPSGTDLSGLLGTITGPAS